MMLKERTNRWARLKLLFVVPVMGGALYAFAQPEVKKDLGLNTVQEVLQSKPDGGDQDIFQFVDAELEAFYNRSPKNAELKHRIRQRQAYVIMVNDIGQLLLNNEPIAKENVKEALKKQMVENKRLAKQKYNSDEYQLSAVLYSTKVPQELIKELLFIIKDAYTEVRADIAMKSGNNSKEFLDKEFPIVICYEETGINKPTYSTPVDEKITGINLKLISKGGKVEKEFSNFTLAELEKELKDLRAANEDNWESYIVGMKVDKKCPMAKVTDVKNVLRKSYLLKLNYQSMR